MSEVVAPGKPVLSREERVALGKEARTRAPRSSHGAWAPAADRRDPVAVFEEEAADRVPGPRPDPVRPDAHLPALVLPRLRIADGR